MLDYADPDWPAERAEELFDVALTGWDDDRGGFYYMVEPGYHPIGACDEALRRVGE